MGGIPGAGVSDAYRVNDVYPCFQGEGCLTGQSMVLVRLQGCGVGCPWCDTKETWAATAYSKADSLAAALGTNPRWAETSADEIAALARSLGHRIPWALLTGGEPAEQPLTPLVAAMKGRGFLVAIETSGTAVGHVGAGLDWVCVSPKPDMPGGRALLPEAFREADEVKMVVGRASDLERLDAIMESMPIPARAAVCLQPVSQNPKATELCIETAMSRGWRLSLQTHKVLALR